MKKYGLLFLLLFGYGEIRAQNKIEVYLNAGLGANAFSLERVENFLGTTFDWPTVNPAFSWGFSMPSDDLQVAMGIDRVILSDRDNYRIRFNQISLTLGPNVKLGEKWRWVPSVGWQINSGVFQRLEQRTSGPGAAPVSIWISAAIEEHAALLNNELSYKLRRVTNLVPHELLFRLQMAIPVSGPSLLELSRSQNDWSGARISSFYSAISLGVRYRIFSLEP